MITVQPPHNRDCCGPEVDEIWIELNRPMQDGTTFYARCSHGVVLRVRKTGYWNWVVEEARGDAAQDKP